MIHSDILDVILSYHRPVCCQAFAGNPNYSLYWVYDKGALKEMLGMTQDTYRQIRSNLGSFLKRNPRTQEWIAAMPWLGPARGANAIPRQREAAARSKIARKTYVGLGPSELRQFT